MRISLLNYFNYYTEIEETFVRRRGKSLLLSPIDWALIESWQERGVPLHVALRAIETVFDGFDRAPKPRTIKGLLYCREEIEAQFEEWQKMQAGRSNGEPAVVDENYSATAVAAHIDSLIDFLRSSDQPTMREEFERAAGRLEELRENLSEDLELVDSSLADVEKLLNTALFERYDRQKLKVFKSTVASQLRAYKESMEAEAYKSTFDLMLLKLLREDAGIPRMGLFYL